MVGKRGIAGLSHLATCRHRSLHSAEHRRRIVLLHSLPRAQNEAGDRGGLHPQEDHQEFPERTLEDQQLGDGRDESAER